jgi:hypothetical protein
MSDGSVGGLPLHIAVTAARRDVEDEEMLPKLLLVPLPAPTPLPPQLTQFVAATLEAVTASSSEERAASM